MKAALLTKLNEPLTVGEVELTELKFGQSLIKIIVSGICGAQLQEIRGEKDNEKHLPHLLGHEGCGIVEKVGPGVTRVKAGDKVILHWRKGDGIESDFPEYIYNGKKIKSGKVTTFSEYSIVSENRLTPVPADTPDDLCALLGCSLSTALGVINNDANLKFGERVLILGCGGVGMNLIKAAKMANVSIIRAADKFPEKKEMVEKAGAIFVCTATNISPVDTVDCIIDTTGDTLLISHVLSLLSPTGRLIMVAAPIKGSCLTFHNPASFFGEEGHSIISTQGGKTKPSRDFPKFVSLWKNGKLDIDGIITHTFKLDEINQAIELVKTGKAGRILIKM